MLLKISIVFEIVMGLTYIVAICATLITSDAFIIPASELIAYMDSEYKVFCFFDSTDVGIYDPTLIDPYLCTHIVYRSAARNPAKTPKDFYKEITAYKTKGIQVLMVLGSWIDSSGDKYTKMINGRKTRKRFVRDMTQFVENNNFDGLVLDWRFPQCYRKNCSRGIAADRSAFVEFVKELRASFEPKGFRLSIMGTPFKKSIDASYDVPALVDYVEWFIIRSFSYHGHWENYTGHIAPLYQHPDDPMSEHNVNFSINYWIEKGVSKERIILGLSLFGESYELAGGGANGLKAAAKGLEEPVPYHEICKKLKTGDWQVVRDPENRMGPYAYSGNEWMSFDDSTMIRIKSQYVKDMGLGGAMIWSLSGDDYKKTCQCERHPLLKAINRVLRGYSNPAPTCEVEERLEGKPNPRRDGDDVTDKPPSTNLTPRSEESSAEVDHPEACDGRLFVPDEESCCRYYVCNRGVLEHRTCPEGLYWNEENCDFPQNSECYQNSNASDHTHFDFTLVQKIRIFIPRDRDL